MRPISGMLRSYHVTSIIRSAISRWVIQSDLTMDGILEFRLRIRLLNRDGPQYSLRNLNEDTVICCGDRKRLINNSDISGNGSYMENTISNK